MSDISLPDKYEALPPPSAAEHWELPLELITPLYGGGAATRQVDRQTPVRAASIRGQLRFWWRALFGGSFASPQQLYARERALFGGLGDKPDDIAASRVWVQVTSPDWPEERIDTDDVSPRDPASYALWPARSPRGTGAPPAERWLPGSLFTLSVRLEPPKGRAAGSSADLDTDQRQLRAALRAWLLFGGVGGRTRRGCGALAISDPDVRADWLPKAFDVGTLQEWLEPAEATAGAMTFASLRESRLFLGRSSTALRAWTESLDWLKEFRQGAHPSQIDKSESGDFARQRPEILGRNRDRYGRSRWPEPDQIRRATKRFDHELHIDDKSPDAWPRAQFGLPIMYRFQDRDRDGRDYAKTPPPPGELGWSPSGRPTDVGQRLASPLIVKPVQLRDGGFAPLALWLHRPLPADAKVGIKTQDGTIKAAAKLSDMPQNPLYKPLEGKQSTADAFMDWLESSKRAAKVAGGKL